MKALVGGILLAAGILITCASGLCSMVYFGIGLATVVHQHSADEAVTVLFSGLMLWIVVGGIPLVLGIGLVFAGRRLLRDTGWNRNDGRY